jgi:hypothetical protein
MTGDTPAPKMMSFHIPEDSNLLGALGLVSLRHAHLDYILRMTIKSVAGVSIGEALDATAFAGSRALRERIQKLARSRLGEGPALLKLQAILERCRRVTDKRNEWIHSIWAREIDGDPMLRTTDHNWTAPPTAADLESLADEISRLTNELNAARLDGFLDDALKQKLQLKGKTE